jgi:hypothetical protein
MGDPKEPVDLPDPVCDLHGNPTFPCPDCEREGKRTDRLLFIVPFGVFLVVGIYLWVSTHSHFMVSP